MPTAPSPRAMHRAIVRRASAATLLRGGRLQRSVVFVWCDLVPLFELLPSSLCFGLCVLVE
ncbi:hypothetical protein HPP92_006828, partial [Vanilla planifolia]